MSKFKGFWKQGLAEDEQKYIVLNENAQVFAGLRNGGTPHFSDDFGDAKTLVRDSQFRTLERVSYFNIFKEYI
jgi:hypothetical protein